jgi:hypothetical protein
MLWRTFKCNNIQQKNRVTGMKCKKTIKPIKKHKKNKPLGWFFIYKKSGFFPTLPTGPLLHDLKQFRIQIQNRREFDF